MDAPPRLLTHAERSIDANRPPMIRFVTTDDFPPFSFVDGSGRLTGYNVELARALCQRLQVACTIQIRRFSDLVQTLADNEADAIVGGLAETEGLRRFVDYGEAYLRLPARFIMRKDEALVPVPESLRARRVAVQAGSRHEAFLADFFPATERVEFNDLPAMLAALSQGEVDAAFASALPLAFWLGGPEGQSCCRFAGGAYVEPAYFGRGMTIPVLAGNTALRRVIDQTLAALEADGIMEDLYLRFFPVGLY